MSLLLPSSLFFGLSFLTVGFVWRSDSNKEMIKLIIASVCHSENDTPVQQQEPQPQFVSQSRFIGNPGFINPGKGKAVQWGKSNLRKVEKLQTLCVKSAEVPVSCFLRWLSVCEILKEWTDTVSHTAMSSPFLKVCLLFLALAGWGRWISSCLQMRWWISLSGLH